ncbi:MAG: copper resistance system multicopper oxidase [Sphingomonas adhaesiva]|uniref:copper resistance system multicopper oxidase n=1 Tax=Sphingomonas adhaesiva TaxID=28212 RepID=UPI002FF98067
MPIDRPAAIDRRTLIRGAARLAGGAAVAGAFPAWAQSGSAGHRAGHDAGRGIGATLSGEEIALTVAESRFGTGGRSAHAVTINGTVPAPLIRLKEGQNVRLAVTNRLKEDTSIHWHGLILPFQMDGVPGVSFPGIRPGETFTYEFPIRQSGTYWYHSHSGMQEAMGHYGPIVIDPAGTDPVQAEREHVIVLSDWSPVHPHVLLRRLKQMGGYHNFQKQTLAGLLAGRDQPLKERIDWGKMRMDPTDISDVTGSTYSFLVNGHGTPENWTGLFAPGERVRLRIVNASAMTNFNVRVPGLAMTVVQCDGQHVQPVETDEFQIGIAETYDVVVRPTEAQAYALVAEAIDRSGLVRATLAPRMGMVAAIPPLRRRPLLTMKDMGMDMSGMDMGQGGVIDLSQPANDSMAGHSMKMRDTALLPPTVKAGPGVATVSAMPADRVADKPTGLEDVDHRVLTYADLKSLTPRTDTRTPTRRLDIHLTANMERYMWSFDGVKLSEGAERIPFRHNERVRVTLINDTMMPHPIHIHGHFFDLVTGAGLSDPRKHTVNVLPGGKASFDLTADAIGDWAFHCHMLMHMHTGMMRVVTVRHEGDAA